MSLQLGPEQVRRLVERANRERRRADADANADAGAGDAAPCYRLPAGGGSADAGLDPMRKRRHTSYLLFLEGTDASPDTPFWTRVLDSMVQGFQPEPALTHVELFIPPDRLADDVHFSTYLGKWADWGSGFPGGGEFYLGKNQLLWRAVPIMAMDAAPRLRRELEAHRETPYGSCATLYRYPFSVPPLRAAAGLLADTPKVTPAHCASLTARCLKAGLPELGLYNPSAWYGPTTLYLEMTRTDRMRGYAQQRQELEHLRTLPEHECTLEAAETLVLGSDMQVMELDCAVCADAIDHLCDRVVRLGVTSDVPQQIEAQQVLGRALVRWSQLQRSAARAVAAALDGGGAADADADGSAQDALSDAHTEHAHGGSGSDDSADVAEWTPMRLHSGSGGGAGRRRASSTSKRGHHHGGGGSHLAWAR